jgi:hypothetical protein
MAKKLTPAQLKALRKLETRPAHVTGTNRTYEILAERGYAEGARSFMAAYYTITPDGQDYLFKVGLSELEGGARTVCTSGEGRVRSIVG